MNKIKLSFLACGLIAALIFSACKGKEGSKGDTGSTGGTGPTGSGVSISTYTGTITSTYETVSAPALTINSMVDVRISSETNRWHWTDYDRLDYNTLTVGFYTTAPGMIGGTYMILIQSPD